MIKHKYKPIIDVLLKMSNRESINYIQNLSIILLADQSTISISINFIPYYIYYKSKLVLSIKLEIPTW